VTIRFHSVGLDSYRWSYSTISESVQVFEKKMAALRKYGYQTIFFRDYIPHETHDRKEVVLTFDDGYLDNWVVVFPILIKYGLKATIFVNPDFVDRRNVIRPQVYGHDFEGINHSVENCCVGFLSWPEMREMETSGLVDIQSHSLTHTWYFSGPKIIDFWNPGAATDPHGPVWMLWNKFPDIKPYYLTKAIEYESEMPYGTPIYEHAKALVTRRFFPDEGINDVLIKYVHDNGGVDFFRQKDWRKVLYSFVENNIETQDVKSNGGFFECENEYLERVRTELFQSKYILEKMLNKKINAISWPGGGVNDQVLAIARSLGYNRFTLPSFWADEKSTGRYSDLSRRISSVTRLEFKGRDLGEGSERDFLWHIERNSGSKLHRWLVRCSVVARLGLSYLKWTKR